MFSFYLGLFLIILMIRWVLVVVCRLFMGCSRKCWKFSFLYFFSGWLGCGIIIFSLLLCLIFSFEFILGFMQIQFMFCGILMVLLVLMVILKLIVCMVLIRVVFSCSRGLLLVKMMYLLVVWWVGQKLLILLVSLVVDLNLLLFLLLVLMKLVLQNWQMVWVWFFLWLVQRLQFEKWQNIVGWLVCVFLFCKVQKIFLML